MKKFRNYQSENCRIFGSYFYYKGNQIFGAAGLESGWHYWQVHLFSLKKNLFLLTTFVMDILGFFFVWRGTRFINQSRKKKTKKFNFKCEIFVIDSHLLTNLTYRSLLPLYDVFIGKIFFDTLVFYLLCSIFFLN